MAGHSKWANIRFRKGAQDAKRGKLFTKLIREVVVAVKQGGMDPEANPRLRTAVDKALSNNMTRDAVDRAIKRAAGEGGNENLEDVLYEGYGINGVAVLVFCLTDNRNRTVSEVRHCFSKHGGNLGTDGSVSFQFDKLGQLLFEGVTEEAILDAALEAGADDVLSDEEGVEIRTSPDQFLAVKNALTEAGFESVSADVVWLPNSKVALDVEQAQSFLKMIDKLEDLDDVQNVYSNADLPEEAMSDA